MQHNVNEARKTGVVREEMSPFQALFDQLDKIGDLLSGEHAALLKLLHAGGNHQHYVKYTAPLGENTYDISTTNTFLQTPTLH